MAVSLCCLYAGTESFHPLYDQGYTHKSEPLEVHTHTHTHIHTHTHTHTHTQLHHSNVPTSGLPGLEDLGVSPTLLESNAIAILRRYRDFLDFDKPIDDINQPPQATK